MLSLTVVLFLSQDAPGKRHLILPADVPPPYHTPSRGKQASFIRGKGDAPLKAPPGFRIQVFARGLRSPRNLYALPNGDLLVTESYQHRIRLLRDSDGDGRAETTTVFASGLRLPYGIALRGDWLYVANTDSLVRFRYTPGALKAGAKEALVRGIPSKGWRQHWTRNIAFSPDGSKLYLSVGSESNKSPEAPPRATIQEYDTTTWRPRTFATGLRNPVGLAFRPGTGDLWTTCVERDYMGDHFPPEFVTRVRQGDFFGWPWYAVGNRLDPQLARRNPPKKPVAMPDVLLPAHSVPLGLVFYQGSLFPSSYHGDAFVALKGGRNSLERHGYKVVRIRFEDGKLVHGFEDFITGWLPSPRSNSVWGQPVGLAVGRWGELFISDETGHKVWRVTFGRG
ncbi:MAG TPA: PQQ-dependent sugar dehydrogenase [Fimbriimonadaceae bacterium]|nr:PQQ-dependent sugar dehydrogenase [Fimbriimonadaceae bacterium]